MENEFFGQGIPHAYPQGVRVRMRIGPADPVSGLRDALDVVDLGWLDRFSLSISRVNSQSEPAEASFRLVIPLDDPDYLDFGAYCKVFIDDPSQDLGGGEYPRYFGGYTLQPTASIDGDERVIDVRCIDYGSLLHKPPKQITTQFPPGDGTPVVSAKVALSASAGTDVVFVTDNTKHLYVGKKTFAQNSDGTQKERITITAVDYDTKEVTATLTLPKTSTSTTVADALVGRGTRTVTPASMTNIAVGSNLDVRQANGERAEKVVVTSVTGTTFTAFFTQPKSPNWVVKSYWMLQGGVSDKEVIADGYSMHLGDPPVLTEIESLISHVYDGSGIFVDRTAVEEVILSLPHLKFEAMTPAQAFNLIADQNEDLDKDPRGFMTVLPDVDEGFYPQYYWYDARATDLADLQLVDTLDPFPTTQAQYLATFTYAKDGVPFINYQQVMGANNSYGEYTDDASVDNPDALNYIGWKIAGPVVRDNSLTTNFQCELRAEELVRRGYEKTRWTVHTNAQITPLVLYKPHIVEFRSLHFMAFVDQLPIERVSIDFSEGPARYTFILGDREPLLGDIQRRRAGSSYGLASVSVNADGEFESVDYPGVSPVYYEDFEVDGYSYTYPVDATYGPVDAYLPPLEDVCGAAFTVKKIDDTDNPVTLIPFRLEDANVDNIDGMPELVLDQPGQSATVHAACEETGLGEGGEWYTTGYSPGGDFIAIGNPATIDYLIDGGGSAIIAGHTGQVRASFACQVIGWAMVVKPGETGDLTVEIEKGSHADYPTVLPFLTTEIVAGDKAAEVVDPPLWIEAGDWLVYTVTGTPSGITNATVALDVLKGIGEA
jgi:hypothetical protein